jgi:hypothetical protein
LGATGAQQSRDPLAQVSGLALVGHDSLLADPHQR